MSIRKYQPNDREACLRICESNIPKFLAQHELEEFKTWLEGQDKALLAYGNSESEYYYVFEKDKKVIACGGYYIPKDGSAATMAWGMVDNSFHRLGVGKLMLEYRIRDVIRVYPGKSIKLDTTQHTFEFFEKFGFKVKKVTKDFYAEGLDRYDMIRD